MAFWFHPAFGSYRRADGIQRLRGHGWREVRLSLSFFASPAWVGDCGHGSDGRAHERVLQVLEKSWRGIHASRAYLATCGTCVISLPHSQRASLDQNGIND